MLTKDAFFSNPDFDLAQQSWNISFPSDDKTKSTTFISVTNENIGVIVRKYTSHEARFVLRGNIISSLDLIRLLVAAEELSSSFGCRFLTTQEQIPVLWLDSTRTFCTQGFNVIDESWTYMGPFKPFADRAFHIKQKLFEKNIVPFNAKTTSLFNYKAKIRALLNTSLMMDDFEFDNAIKITYHSPISLLYSQIAWHGHKIVGVLLVASSPEDGVFEIPIRYILPEYRKSWVNALLIAGCVKYGDVSGAKFIKFDANTKTHHETMMLAKKTDCKKIATFNRFQKNLF